MLKFVIKRLLLLIPIVIAISLVAFSLVRLIPGNTAAAYLTAAGIPPTDDAIIAVTHELGLDKPFFTQYFQWLKDAIHFDFGTSFLNNKPVSVEILGAFANTMKLVLVSIIMMLSMSIPLGIFTALFPNGKIDNFGRVFAFIGTSMPSFWLGLLLVQLFSVQLGWFPVSGMGGIKHLILPSFTLAVLYIATYSRVLRNSLLENMGKRYVLFSRARGIKESRIIGNHVFRTSLTPVITTLGVNFGNMLAGTIIIEIIFSWPGIGRLILGSITGRDLPMIQGYIVLMSMVFITINLLADVLCAALDPRIRLER
ncbi:MAG: ABC transporter permease subunit [Clostridiales bacterium]